MEKTKKSILTRERIISSTKQCFIEKGYKDTTVEIVAEITGVDRRTIYRYFPSKEALLLKLAIELFEDFSQHIISLDFDEEKSGLERIRYTFEEQYKYAKERPEVILLMGMIDANVEMKEERVKDFMLLSQSGKNMDNNLAKLIEVGIRDGSIKNTESPIDLAVTINNSLLALATRTVIYNRNNIDWKFMILQAKLLLSALEV